MASDSDGRKWSKKLRGGHVRLSFLPDGTCCASLVGEHMVVAGLPVRARATARSDAAALQRLWETVRDLPLERDPVERDAVSGEA